MPRKRKDVLQAIEANACRHDSPRSFTRLPRGGAPPPKGTAFLIHGSAIKTYAKQPEFSNMQNSNRR